jgi:RimK family alpha-L-glutamate ligase
VRGFGVGGGVGATGTVAILDHSSGTTNPTLIDAWRRLGIDAWLLSSAQALRQLDTGDVALARLDVRPTLDGVEPGLLELLALIRRGVRVLNAPAALLAAHDKLRTAQRLAAAALPHPQTVHLRPGEPLPELPLPLVLKPRFGSWGRDVVCCHSERELTNALQQLRDRGWYRRQGLLAQQLVPPLGHDLRLLVAAGRIVGAIRRRARPGDWRTNYSLGGSLEPAVPPPDACELAIAAAAAIGADFVGVDLLPLDHHYVVLELNGAVDFEPSYALPGQNVHEAIAAALGLSASLNNEPINPLERTAESA